MNLTEAWDKFTATGSVYDYIEYLKADKAKESGTFEVHDRRIDNTGKQCR